MQKKYTITLFASDNEIRNLNNDPNNLDAAALGISIADTLQNAMMTDTTSFIVNVSEAIKN